MGDDLYKASIETRHRGGVATIDRARPSDWHQRRARLRWCRPSPPSWWLYSQWFGGRRAVRGWENCSPAPAFPRRIFRRRIRLLQDAAEHDGPHDVAAGDDVHLHCRRRMDRRHRNPVALPIAAVPGPFLKWSRFPLPVSEAGDPDVWLDGYFFRKSPAPPTYSVWPVGNIGGDHCGHLGTEFLERRSTACRRRRGGPRWRPAPHGPAGSR